MLLPTTELQLPFTRTFGSAALGAVGTATPSLTIGPALTGGFYAQSFRVPEDYDRTREGRLYIFIGKGLGVGPAAGNVQMDAMRTLAPPTGIAVDQNFTAVQAIPAAWPAWSWLQVEIGTALAPFIPGGTLKQFGLCGVRVLRTGPAVADTWTGSLEVVLFALLRYHRLCLQCIG